MREEVGLCGLAYIPEMGDFGGCELFEKNFEETAMPQSHSVGPHVGCVYGSYGSWFQCIVSLACPNFSHEARGMLYAFVLKEMLLLV